jgi:hypothetical protein
MFSSHIFKLVAHSEPVLPKHPSPLPFELIDTNQALSENSIVGPRASGFSSGKDGEAGDIGYIVDAAGRSPGGKQAARSQIEFSGRADGYYRTKQPELQCFGQMHRF